MAEPDDEEPETFVQKAVKVALITIPMVMYVSWAYKKFVPCPRVKTPQARPSFFKKSVAKSKRKNKKSKCQAKQETESCEDLCQDSRSGKQEQERESCQCTSQDSRFNKLELTKELRHQNQLSWFGEMREKEMEPTKQDYMEYLKRPTKQCCESMSESSRDSYYSKTDSEQEPNDHEHMQQNDETSGDNLANKNCCESNIQSDTITPEAFDRLFEQHFKQCVEDFKQHKKWLQNKIEHLGDNCDIEQKNENPQGANKKGKYMECLADLNFDKDFGCDPNFYSKDTNTPYTVKDYKSKSTRGTSKKKGISDQHEASKNSYLKCLTDLNMDKQLLEGKQEIPSYQEEGKRVNDESCPMFEVNNNETSAKKGMDKCESCSQNETKERRERKSNSEYTQQEPVQDKTYKNSDTDEYGCDPHANTKNTGKCGRTKGDPCDYRSEKENDTDEDALKDLWHACGPPKGLRKGCWVDKPSL